MPVSPATTKAVFQLENAAVAIGTAWAMLNREVQQGRTDLATFAQQAETLRQRVFDLYRATKKVI